eukprot:1658843-Pleurochrysis_carterae.AAC.1
MPPPAAPGAPRRSAAGKPLRRQGSCCSAPRSGTARWALTPDGARREEVRGWKESIKAELRNGRLG